VAAQLKQDLGIDAQLIRGSKGIFEVAVDGRVVAAKGPAGFPTPEQAVAAVRASRPA